MQELDWREQSSAAVGVQMNFQNSISTHVRHLWIWDASSGWFSVDRTLKGRLLNSSIEQILDVGFTRERGYGFEQSCSLLMSTVSGRVSWESLLQAAVQIIALVFKQGPYFQALASILAVLLVMEAFDFVIMIV